MTELIIQSIYRGNKIRNIIKYYNRLPDDIQIIIIKYIRKDYYYMKYKKILNKIVYKKIIDIFYLQGYFYTLLDYICYNNYIDFSYIFTDIDGIDNYIIKLIYAYYILNKYNSILTINNSNKHYYDKYYTLSLSNHLFDNDKLKNELILFNKNLKCYYNGHGHGRNK